jgi:hypothetical protein
MSLQRIEDSHWTAQASFVISLVAGCLSVYYSCAISPAFQGLHSAEDIKDFLSKPAPSAEMRKYNTIWRQHWFKHKSSTQELEVTGKLNEIINEGRWTVPSAPAAIMLVVPMTLLNAALGFFILGLGIYLGKLYSASLIPSYGAGSIGILVCYILAVVFGLHMYYSALSLKYTEAIPLTRWRKSLDVISTHVTQDPREQNGNEIGALEEVISSARERDMGAGSPADNEAPARELSSQVGQPRHTWEGRRLHYTESGFEHTNTNRDTYSTEAQPIGDHTTQQHFLDSSIPLGTLSTSATSTDDLRTILSDLIRNQEQGLHINKRLLEALTS